MTSGLADISTTDVAGKRVLIRADLNVPMKRGKVTDATRIERFAPTVRALLDRGAAVVIMTHLGRPDGEYNPHYSTRALVPYLAEALGTAIEFAPDCIGHVAERTTCNLRPGQVALLENVRFHPGEMANSSTFALRLSVNGDLYVNDAFSCAHRAHASTHAIAAILPSYAGSSLLAEVQALATVLETPRKPVAALIGGAKVSTKIGVLKNLISRVDFLIIGGGMANTFLAALGRDMGKSLVEPDAIGLAAEIMGKARLNGCELVLPFDLVAAAEFAANAPSTVVSSTAMPAGMMALDVGEATRKRIMDVLATCRTLLWNGPLGAFEIAPFGEATFAVARIAADLTEAGKLKTVAGGGDTVAALNAAGVTERFSYVSTAGGAFLEWLEGRELPGIAALKNSHLNKEIA